MTPDGNWTAEAIENVLGAQGLRLAPGRAAKIAAGFNASLGVEDPLLRGLEFEADPAAYALAVRRCGAK